MRRARVIAALALVLLAACTARDTVPPTGARALAIGDSVLAWNGFGGNAIPDVVARATGIPFANLSASGARISHSSDQARAKGGDIAAQFPGGTWDWVLLNGGANDLLFECGCKRCEGGLNRLIAADGRAGEIPALVARIRATGARVMLLGYYDGNARPNFFSGCGEIVDRLNERLERLAQARGGVFYVSAGDVIDPGDPGHWAVDRVHPSRRGSALIGAHVAARICAVDRAAGGRAICRNQG